jgi:hypothetical protein
VPYEEANNFLRIHLHLPVLFRAALPRLTTTINQDHNLLRTVMAVTVCMYGADQSCTITSYIFRFILGSNIQRDVPGATGMSRLSFWEAASSEWRVASRGSRQYTNLKISKFENLKMKYNGICPALGGIAFSL